MTMTASPTRSCPPATTARSQVRIWADGEVWVNDHDGDRLATLPPLKG